MFWLRPELPARRSAHDGVCERVPDELLEFTHVHLLRALDLTRIPVLLDETHEVVVVSSQDVVVTVDDDSGDAVRFGSVDATVLVHLLRLLADVSVAVVDTARDVVDRCPVVRVEVSLDLVFDGHIVLSAPQMRLFVDSPSRPKRLLEPG